jgi:hypothetical protein
MREREVLNRACECDEQQRYSVGLDIEDLRGFDDDDGVELETLRETCRQDDDRVFGRHDARFGRHDAAVPR